MGKEKTEQNLMKLSYNIKQTKLHILKILEGKKRKGQRTYLKSKAKNFPNLRKDLDMLIQEAQ